MNKFQAIAKRGNPSRDREGAEHLDELAFCAVLYGGEGWVSS
jgi:hypothetical protein